MIVSQIDSVMVHVMVLHIHKISVHSLSLNSEHSRAINNGQGVYVMVPV